MRLSSLYQGHSRNPVALVAVIIPSDAGGKSSADRHSQGPGTLGESSLLGLSLPWVPARRPAWGWEPGTETQVAWDLREGHSLSRTRLVWLRNPYENCPPHPQATQPHPFTQRAIRRPVGALRCFILRPLEVQASWPLFCFPSEVV